MHEIKSMKAGGGLNLNLTDGGDVRYATIPLDHIGTIQLLAETTTCGALWMLMASLSSDAFGSL